MLRNQPVGRVLSLATALAAALTVQSALWAQANFLDTITFGDSLTHNDLLGLVYSNPQAMYGDDPHEAVFVKGAVSGDDLNNYAVAGSTSSQVTTQIDFYEFFRALGFHGRATLIGYEIGGNDVLDDVDLLATFAPGTNAAADNVINSILRNMRRDLTYLYVTHRQAQFVIWTLPDVSQTPAHWGDFNSTQLANLRAHLERVNRQIRRVGNHPRVVVLDVYAELQLMAANPPVIRGQQLVGPPAYGGFDHIFADEIHPTAVSNALLANRLIELINAKWGDTIPLYTEQELAALARIP